MTETEARELLISGMNYAAYRETGASLFDSDKNRLFGEEHYKSNRIMVAPSPWGEGAEFEEKMAMLLTWALQLGTSLGSYADAIELLRSGDDVMGRIIARAQVTR